MELILWIAYLTYFSTFKILDCGILDNLSEKQKKTFSIISVFLLSMVLGFLVGFMTPKVDTTGLSDVVYYGISGVIVFVAISIFLVLVKKMKKIERMK